MRHDSCPEWVLIAFVLSVGIEDSSAVAASKKSGRTPSATAVPTAFETASGVDQLIRTELQTANSTVAGLTNDEDFLRRVSFDIAGTPPTSQQVTLFGLNPDPNKRSKIIEELLASSKYGENWASYWRDVIFLSETNMRGRGAAGTYEAWMAEQLNQNRPWDAVVSDLLTATGNVAENGATALIFAHSAEPEEVAAEACRIFLGIQIQCANCHDHPSDVWKREQFHELAAYFPRTAVRPIMVDGMQRGFEVVSVNQTRRAPAEMLKENAERLFLVADRNRDRKLTKAEVDGTPQAGPLARLFDRVLENGDTNKDNAISLDEIRKLQPPMNMPGQGATEYYMPDLKDPTSRGKLVQPKFFVDGSRPGEELSDEERRGAVAKAFTATDNPWFARAVINRVWHEMLGEGFYMPVDDLGPTRTPTFPQVLDLLVDGFVANKYDLKWLVRTIANTQTYQRQVRSHAASPDALPFASQTPTRLRSDQLFTALATVLGVSEPTPPRGVGMMGLYAINRGPRSQFNQIFTFDPSTPQEDITGNVQQALFLMNTPLFRNASSSTGNSRLAQILRSQSDDQDAVAEVYLLTLSREPSDRELKACQQYIRDVGNRGEAYEDLLWGLLNSSEFLSRR